MIADGDPPRLEAARSNGHLVELLRSVRYLGKHPALQQELAAPILAVANDTSAGDARVQALGALGWTRRDAATFDRLAQEVLERRGRAGGAAALRSLQAFPEEPGRLPASSRWRRAIVKRVAAVPPAERTTAAVLDAIQFGERLAATLPADAGRAVRRDLRALGVQVVRIQALPEQLRST